MIFQRVRTQDVGCTFPDFFVASHMETVKMTHASGLLLTGHKSSPVSFQPKYAKLISLLRGNGLIYQLEDM